MDAAGRLNLSQLIDASSIGRFHIRAFFLCAASVVTAGFDAAALSYVGPAIMSEYRLSWSQFESVQYAGTFGLLIGSMLFSMLADKFGRRPALIAGTLTFSVLTFLTAHAGSSWMLLALRLVGGIGMGSIIPNATALVAEYSPRQKRIALVMVTTVGFAAGTRIGHLVSAWLLPSQALGSASWLLPSQEWRSVLYVGGFVPLVVVLLMIRWLPESLQLLVVRRQTHRVGEWLKQLVVTRGVGADAKYTVSESRRRCLPLIHLFMGGRAATTLLYWTVNFTNGLSVYLLTALLPLVLRRTGSLSDSTARSFSDILIAGGLLGTFGLAWLIARKGFTPALMLSFSVATAAIAIMGSQSVRLSLPMLTGALFLASCGVFAGQQGLNAMVATSYPTYMRSTGVGFGLGVGRVGAILGPYLAGGLLERPIQSPFAILAVPAVISTLVMLALHFASKRQSPAETREESFEEHGPPEMLPIGTRVRIHGAARRQGVGVIKDVKPRQYLVEFPGGENSWAYAHLVGRSSDVRMITVAKWMGILTFVVGGGWWGFLAAYLLVNPLERGQQLRIVLATAGMSVVLLILPTAVFTAIARCKKEGTVRLNDAVVIFVLLAMLVAVGVELIG